MKIIDFHAHTTNNKIWNMHVETATIADLEALAERFGVVKIVLVATYFPFKKSGVYNKPLLERVAGHERFIAFGSLDAMNDLDKGLAELRDLAERKMIKGLKLYPGYQKFDYSARAAYPIYELAEKYNLPVMIHTGELHHCCPKDSREKRKYRCQGRCQIDDLQYLAEPRALELAIRNFPNVRFVMSHLANPYFADLRRMMEIYPNIYTDISGQFLSGSAEDTVEYKKVVCDEIRKFLVLPSGADRLLFATDFPVQSYADSIALVKDLGLDKETEEKIFYHNAKRLLNL